jgi:hypothetical protein
VNQFQQESFINVCVIICKGNPHGMRLPVRVDIMKLSLVQLFSVKCLNDDEYELQRKAAFVALHTVLP